MPSQQAEEYCLAVESSQADKSVLSALQRIRSISLHPYTYVDVTEEQYIRDSARLTLTFRILDDIAERDEKALIFVEFLKMQGFLLEAIQRRYGLAEPILVVNGTVSGSKRKLRVDAFQKRPGFDAMILSPRAGGVGLTLTAANHVIHLSRWWNPAVEDQCTDRAHRIGQDRCVHVYYPIAIHPEYGEYSFDIRLNDLLTKKRKLNRAVLAPTAPSKRDMEALYNLTVTDAHREGATTEKVTDLEAIDAMEPIAFEEWVLKQLAKAGYRVRKTPYQDGGADGVAYREVFGESHAVFIQCKHTQGEGHCDHHAVEEVIRSRERYDQVKADSVLMLVVTNAYGFTKKARQTAKDRGVELIDRRELRKLQRFSTSSR